VAAKTDQLQIRVTAGQKRALRDAARRAGLDVSAYVLERSLPSQESRLRGIATALARGDDHRFALAELHDALEALAPAEFAHAVGELDLHRLSPFLQNYVTAMVEQAASRKGVPPPAWTRDVEPLDRPWFASTLAGLRLYLLRVSPVAFKRRNLFVDATVGDRV
jgi:hypothetical protein